MKTAELGSSRLTEPDISPQPTPAPPLASAAEVHCMAQSLRSASAGFHDAIRASGHDRRTGIINSDGDPTCAGPIDGLAGSAVHLADRRRERSHSGRRRRP